MDRCSILQKWKPAIVLLVVHLVNFVQNDPYNCCKPAMAKYVIASL